MSEEKISVKRIISIILLVTVGFGLFGADRFIVGTVSSEVLSWIAMGPWFYTVPYLAALCISLFAGPWCDYLGLRRVLLWGMILTSIGTGLSGLSRTVLDACVYRALTGIGDGLYYIGSAAYLGAILPRWRGFAVNMDNVTFIAVGPVCGMAAGYLLARGFGWSPMFWIVGVVGIPLAFLIYKYSMEIVVEKVRFREIAYYKAWSSVLKYRGAVLSGFAYFFYMLGGHIAIAWMVTYLLSRGFDIAMASILFLIPCIIGTLLSIPICIASDIVGRRPVLATLALLVIITAPFYLTMSPEMGIIELMVRTYAFNIPFWSIWALPVVVSQESAPPDLRGTATGLTVFLGFLAIDIFVPLTYYLTNVAAIPFLNVMLMMFMICGIGMLITTLLCKETCPRVLERKGLKPVYERA